MSLDRSSPMPLWAQLETALRTRLDSNEFDERFPTDSELVEQYGVSRHTVREAIRHLNKTGILRRERGRGTVVNRAEFEQPLGALYSLFQSIETATPAPLTETGLPEPLADIVSDCLRKRIEDRPANCGEIRAVLRSDFAPHQMAHTPPPAPRPLRGRRIDDALLCRELL